ncbi:MAG: NADH:ubiquinone reductase (Na(+)-transporting) subunit C [Simkaniaceae bacterium]|nr:NADH:ubiquinone reductase (Na(+)-transporting) subunit C [Simkaniaceae bacterium]
MNEPSSNGRTLAFVVTLCFTAALILSVLASALKVPQEEAKEIFRSKQLLIAAHILDFEGKFISTGKMASHEEILSTYQTDITPMLVTEKGDLFTFAAAGLDEPSYLQTHAKQGYSKLTYKLIYVIKQGGYVIPINGYGLWDAIYGYLGIGKNGDTVIGMSWYDQKETPGLGGEIANPDWEEQFYGKVIFQKNSDGTTNYARSPLGIQVVKGSVIEMLGTTPAADSAVDGISGATITVTGVNSAIKNSLAPYRNFLLKVQR